MIRMVELFAGIGAQAQAMEDLGIPHTSIVCEIDEKAYRSYCAIHGDAPNLGDITKVEHLPDCDLLTYSFPCQDLSIAGLQRGMSEGTGTRSSLLWEVGRLLRDAVERERAPEVLLMENVDAILNGSNIRDFDRWISQLSDMGYTSAYKVLNAADYGVPQSRRRCFMVSMTKGRRFRFPEGCPDGRVLRDVLEEHPDESVYLTEEQIVTYERHRIRHEAQGHGLGWRPQGADEVSRTVTTKPERHGSTWLIECGNLNKWAMERANRVYGVEGSAPTICARSGKWTGPYIESDEPTLRIRCLTPLECFRLQGFPDEAYEKAAAVCPKSALYKQAGNSIAVPCLREIFRALYVEHSWISAPTLEAFA